MGYRGVSFPAQDDVDLFGLMYLLPRCNGHGGRTAGRTAQHGGPSGQARPNFDAIDQYLLQRGIAIFDLNFRGSTGYGKTFARPTTSACVQTRCATSPTRWHGWLRMAALMHRGRRSWEALMGAT